MFSPFLFVQFSSSERCHLSRPNPRVTKLPPFAKLTELGYRNAKWDGWGYILRSTTTRLPSTSNIPSKLPISHHRPLASDILLSSSRYNSRYTHNLHLQWPEAKESLQAESRLEARLELM